MALLRALGASRRQVLGSVMVEALVTGVIASAVGVVLGFGVAIVLRSIMAAIGIDIPADGLTIEANAIIIPMVVGIVITVLSALFPARKASKIPPVAAMRDVAVDDSGQSIGRVVAGFVMVAIGIGLTAVGLFGNSDSGFAARRWRPGLHLLRCGGARTGHRRSGRGGHRSADAGHPWHLRAARA